MAWNPIETAPKDTDLLLTVAGSNNMFVGRYLSQYNVVATLDGVWEYDNLDQLHGDFYYPAGWQTKFDCQVCGEYEYQYTRHENQPTHWQPLPEPIN